MHASSTVDIRDIIIRGDETASSPDIILRHEEWRRDTVHDSGALMVEINVDGEPYDVVTMDLGPTGDLEAIDRAIASLTTVRWKLASMYGALGERDPGTCLEPGDWGRCTARSGHTGVHEFPTEEQWKRALSGAA